MMNFTATLFLRSWLPLAAALFCATFSLQAEEFRWTGNSPSTPYSWQDPANWSVEVAGNWVPAPAPPGSDDDAVFNETYFSTAFGNSGEVFVPSSAGGVHSFCRDLNFSDAPAIAFNGAADGELEVYGSITLNAGMTFAFPGVISLWEDLSDPNFKTITSNGVHFTCGLEFSGDNEWHFTDDFWSAATNPNVSVVHTNGHIVTEANVTLEHDWFSTGGANCSVTFQPGSTVTVTAYRTVRFANLPIANFSAANTDFVFLNSGILSTYNNSGTQGLEVHDVTFLGASSDGVFEGMKSNGKVEFFGSGTLKINPECNDVVFHGNGDFYDIGFGSTLMKCKNITLAPGKIYSFVGASVIVKSGGSLIADGGDCSGIITLQTTYDLSHGFISEGPDLTLEWCTLFNVFAIAGGGSPTFTATDCIDLNPGGSPGWTIDNPAGADAYWQGDEDNDWFNKDNWSTGCVPNALDDVYFDADIVDPANTTASIDIQQLAYCRSMIWQDWPAGVTPTILDNFSMLPQTLHIYGSLVFQVAGTNSFDGQIIFRKDLTEIADRPPLVSKVITSAGNHFWGEVFITGHDDTYTLTDNSLFDHILHHSDGFLVNPPGITLTMNGPYPYRFFFGPGQGLDFHNSTIKWTNTGEFYCGYPSFNSAGSLVWMPQGGYVYGGGNVFHDVTFENAGGNFYDGGTDNSGTVTFGASGRLQTGTFKNIHHAIFEADGSIDNFYGFDQLDFAPGHYYTLSDGASIEIDDDDGDNMASFNASGSNCENYTYIMGLGPTAATITSDFDLNFQNVTMRNVQKGATSVNYDATGVKMENVNWNFNAQTARQLYWTAASGDWFEADNWSEGSATGPLADCPPDWDDDVFFGHDMDLSGQTVFASQTHLFCHDMDWSECASNLTNAPHFTQTSKEINIYGSLAFTPGMNHPLGGEGTLTFWSNAPDETIHCADENIGYYAIFSGNGTWHFEDNFWSHILLHSSGTIITNSHDVAIDYVSNSATGSNAEIFAGNSQFIHIQGNGGLDFGNYTPGKAHTQTANFIFHNGGDLNGNGFDAVQDVTFIKLPPYDMHQAQVRNIPLARNVKFLTGIIGSTLINHGTVTEKLLFEENGTIEGNDQFTTTITPTGNTTNQDQAKFDIQLTPAAPTNYINEAEFLGNGTINSNTYFNKLTFTGGHEYVIQAGKTLAFDAIDLPGDFDISGESGLLTVDISSSNPTATPGMDNYAHIFKNGNPLCADYLYLNCVNHDGSAEFYVPGNYDDVNDTNFGWLFDDACPGCIADPEPAPSLDASSVTSVQIGGSVVLVLTNLPAGYDDVAWYIQTGPDNYAEVYSGANSFTTPPVTGPITYFGAGVNDEGCLTEFLEVVICILPDVPTISGEANLCPGGTANLSIASGNLNDATDWHWYEGSCGGTPIGTGTSISVTPSFSTTYYVRGEGGCTETDGLCGTFTVTVDNAPPTPICAPIPDVTLDASGNGFTPANAAAGGLSTDNCGISSETSPATTFNCFNVFGANVIILTVTDLNGNTATANCSVNVIDILPPTIQCSTDQFVESCQPIAISGLDPMVSDNCSTGGDLILEYIIFGSTPGSGTGSVSGVVFSPGYSTIDYTVTDAAGNTATCTFEVNVLPEEVVVSIAGNLGFCQGGSTVLTASGGDTYEWSTGEMTASITVDEEDTYTVTATLSNGCTGTASVDAAPFPLPVVNVVTNAPFCESIGIIMTETGGDAVQWDWAGPFSWMFSSTTTNVATIFPANVDWATDGYSVTVTDANGCTNSMNFAIGDYIPAPVLNLPPNQTLCAGGTTAAINFTSTPPGATFNWTCDHPEIGNPPIASSGTGNIPAFQTTNLTGSPIVATFSVTPDIANCEGQAATFTITVNPAGSVTVQNLTHVSCFGGSNGAISIDAPIGSTFVWTGPGSFNSTSQNLTGLQAGNYSVTATAPGGCTATAGPISVSQPAAPLGISNIVVTAASCSGSSDGAIDISVSGGTPTYSFSWSNGPASEDLTNIFPGNYTVTVTDANGCTFVSASILVNFGSVSPTVDQPANISVCHGAPTGNIVFTGTPAGVLFDWTIDNPAIGSGSGATGVSQINSFIAINGGIAPVVATLTVTPVLNGCPGLPKTFTITVNPIPTMNPVADITVCGGDAVNIPLAGLVVGTAFNWTYTTAPIGRNIGIFSPGTGDVIFTASNSYATPTVATFSVTPTVGGCPCAIVTFKITVNPKPVVNTVVSNKTYCHSAAGTMVLGYGFTGTAGSVITWNYVGDHIGLPSNSGGSLFPGFIPTNTGTTPLSGTVTVTATKYGCSFSKTYTITVNPTPTVAAIPNQTACHNDLKTIALNTNLPSPPTTFIWTSSNATTGLTAGTFSLPDRTFTATNTSTVNKTSNVTVKAMAYGCPSPTRSFVLTVKPTPSVVQPADRSKCHAEMSGAISFSSFPAISGATYAWSASPAAAALAIGMPASSGTGTIPTFSVINTGTAPVTVTITVSASKSGCSGPVKTFTFTAKPKPVLDPMPAPTVCAGATVSIPLTCPVSGTTFSWSNSNAAIGLPGGTNTGLIPNFTATNSGNAQITGIITVTPTANGCVGPVATTLVNVNPAVSANAPANQIVESGDAVAVVFTGSPTSTVYNWTQVSGPDIGLGAAPVSGSGNLFFTADNPTSVDIIGTFEVTPTAAGCTGATQTFTITVQPFTPLPPGGSERDFPTLKKLTNLPTACDIAGSKEPGAAFGFLLHQNYPNPFSGETSILFCLPSEMPATISIFENSGKLVYRQSGNFPSGENSILLNANDLGASRVLICRLETPLGVAVRQMLRVD